MRPLVIALALLGACTPTAVTPPPRTFVMTSPMGPPPGATDAQIDLAKIGQMFGPQLVSGNGRLRHAVHPNVVVEGEAGLLKVTNEPGTEPGRRVAYTGRLGALWQTDDRRLALMTGVGGGTSVTAGDWAGVDIGGIVSGQHRYIRPVLSADFGYSAPIGKRRTFDVDDDGNNVTLQLTRNYVGKVSVGVELGRKELAFLAGITFVKFWQLESARPNVSDPEDDRQEGFIAAGVGVRAQL